MFIATTNIYAVIEALFKIFKEQLEICRENEALLTVQCDRGYPQKFSRQVRAVRTNDKINSKTKKELEDNPKECSTSKKLKKSIAK